MSQTEKAQYYKELQAAGVQFEKHYRDYSTAELKLAVDKLHEARPPAPPDPLQEPPPQPQVDEQPPPTRPVAQVREEMTRPSQPSPPVRAKDPDEMPGQRLNNSVELEPIRTDEQGRIWFQEEVRKPAFPKPRGRRVLKYMESGVETKKVQNGEYVETFEVAGNAARRESEVKITLPSYQVGIYKDPRFPFKVHVYNERQGFDLFEVQDYYGGAELVPTECKRVYVENVLCYDIRTVVRAIQTEFRQLQLANRLPGKA